MSKFKPFGLSARQIASEVNSQKLAVEDLCEYYLQRIAKVNPKLNAILDFDRSYIAEQFDAVKKRVLGGEKMALAGVPIAIKDNIAVKDRRLSCASRMLESFKSIYNATVIDRLAKAGAVFIGKANCDEFAMGSSNENSAFGSVANPWHFSYVPGGSSGGSAASVAADLCPLSLGSDTGGSIRQPASFCGIVGVKPTYGLVSRYGLVAFGSSLDQIGPFARSISDAALVLEQIQGHDVLDSTSLPKGFHSYEDLFSKPVENKKPLDGFRVGIVRELLGAGTHPSVKLSFENAIKVFSELGAEISEVNLSSLDLSVAAYYVIATAEASSNLARFDGVRFGHRNLEAKDITSLYETSRSEGFGREVKQRIMLGTFALSSGYYDAYYSAALRARRAIVSDFSKAFQKVDLLLSPTSPIPPFKLGEKSNDPLAMYLSDTCTIGVNLAGVPAVSIPAGFTQDGLPIGLQVIGKWNDEYRMFQLAHAYENATQWWHTHEPKI